MQLCAGQKIVDSKPKIYEYTGKFRETKFEEIQQDIKYIGRIRKKVRTNQESTVVVVTRNDLISI